MIKGTEAQVQGIFRIEVFGDDGHYKDYGWTKNMLLDAGIEELLLSDWFELGEFRVGSGTTPPQPTDTGLENQIAAIEFHSEGVSDRHGYDEAGGYGWSRYTISFSKGAVVGSVSEIGAATQSWTGGRLITRSLLKDEEGNPISVQLTEDDTLIVVYEFRQWWITPEPYTIEHDNAGTVEQISVTHSEGKPSKGLPSGADYFFIFSQGGTGWEAHANPEKEFQVVDGSIDWSVTLPVGEAYEIARISNAESYEPGGPGGPGVMGGFIPYGVSISFDPPIQKDAAMRTVISGANSIARR